MKNGLIHFHHCSECNDLTKCWIKHRPSVAPFGMGKPMDKCPDCKREGR